MRGRIQRHVGWKLFLSYLAVILVGIVVLASATEFAAPSSFDRHMSTMSSMMIGMMRNNSAALELDLYENYRKAVNEALSLAAFAAFGAAVAVSLFVSRRVILPVQEMMSVSRRIAAGHYDERVEVPAMEPDELDELGQLALSFNQMATTLEQTETMRRDLIGNVAHELRTPLTSIKGNLEALIDGVVPAEAETFQKIHREADRLQRLVNDLQELSQVEAGAYPLNLKLVHISQLVQTVCDRLGHQFEEKGVALVADLPTEHLLVAVDKDRIGQVLLNLVGNALQYTPAGGQVTIRARSEGTWARVDIKDTGIGIGAEHIDHVFTRFYRVDKSRSRVGGGSGIGLTIAKHLVEAHGGHIRATSTGNGAGSTFSFSLPTS